jgi:hypothetical protein
MVALGTAKVGGVYIYTPHLLSGEPDIPIAPAYSAPAITSSGLEARVADLEAELEIL